MGWFGDLWDTIEQGASQAWGNVKKIAGSVYDTVRKPVDWIAGAGDVVSKIPFLGTLAQPVIAAAKGAKSVLDQGKAIADVAKQIGLKSGGVVPSRTFQKAE